MLLPTMRFGETRSGKPIFTYFAEDISAISSEVSTFTAADSFDAHALFEHLIRRELRKHGKDASQLETFRNHSEVHTSRLTATERKNEMTSLSIITIIGVAKYGKSRADHLFVD